MVRKKPKTPRRVAASYDAGGHDPDLRKHWQYATGYSADAELTSQVRRTIRNRARYEVLENNSYGRGILKTLSDDTIGTGPRLQVNVSPEINEVVEREFGIWARAICLADKLQTMKTSKTVDGEAVALLITNPPIPHPVKLDLQLIECDRLESPWLDQDSKNYVQGVHLDEFGNPVAYDILQEHPGDNYLGVDLWAYDIYNRSQVIHFYRRDRPEQHRGVSEVVTSLPLFAFMRRFTLATVTAAETAANHATVLQTDAPAESGSEDLTWDEIELNRNAATVLPREYKIGQMSPEHPATTYQMFKREILNEVARCLSMPYNVAAADSSGYNYASGRLDHQVYDRSLKVEQSKIEKEVLDRLLGEWLLEASLLGILPAALAGELLGVAGEYGSEGIAIRLPHTWNWDRRPHVDPSKEASAQRTRLQTGTTSRQYEMLESGLDIQEIDEQAAQSYGFESVEQYRQVLATSIFSNGNQTAAAAEDEPTDENEVEDEQPSEAEA